MSDIRGQEKRKEKEKCDDKRLFHCHRCWCCCCYWLSSPMFVVIVIVVSTTMPHCTHSLLLCLFVGLFVFLSTFLSNRKINKRIFFFCITENIPYAYLTFMERKEPKKKNQIKLFRCLIYDLILFLFLFNKEFMCCFTFVAVVLNGVSNESTVIYLRFPNEMKNA